MQQTSKRLGRSISLLKKDRYEEKLRFALRYKGCLREEIAALGVRRASIERVIAELLDASRSTIRSRRCRPRRSTCRPAREASSKSRSSRRRPSANTTCSGSSAATAPPLSTKRATGADDVALKRLKRPRSVADVEPLQAETRLTPSLSDPSETSFPCAMSVRSTAFRYYTMPSRKGKRWTNYGAQTRSARGAKGRRHGAYRAAVHQPDVHADGTVLDPISSR